MVLRLAAGAPLADEPHLVTRAMVMSDDRVAVGDANAQRAELGAKHPLRSTTPRDRPEGVRPEGGDNLLCATRLGSRFMRRARSARRRLGLDGAHPSRHREYVCLARDTDDPPQSLLRESAAKVGTDHLAPDVLLPFQAGDLRQNVVGDEVNLHEYRSNA